MEMTLPPTMTCKIEHGGASRQLRLFDTPLGKLVCQEVFSGKSYPQLPFVSDAKTIVDIGANIGASTVYFALLYPNARLFAFEPTPSNFALLTENTADLPQIKVFSCGLFDCDRQAQLFHGLQDAVQNSICKSGEQTQVSETVTLRDAGPVFRELALDTIDILKLDTEGCEVQILRSVANWLPRTAAIYVEFHSASDRLEIDRLLTSTHVLYSGEITHLCRGVLRYVAKDRLPPNHEREMGAFFEQ